MNQYRLHRRQLLLVIAAAFIIQVVNAELDVSCQVADRGRYHVRVNVPTPVRVRPDAECSDGKPTKRFGRPQLDLGLQQKTTDELSYTIGSPFVDDRIPVSVPIVSKPTTDPSPEAVVWNDGVENKPKRKHWTQTKSTLISIDGVESQSKRKPLAQTKSISISNDGVENRPKTKPLAQTKSITISNDDNVDNNEDDDNDDEVIDIVMRPSESRCADRSGDDQHLLICSPGLMISHIKLMASIGTCNNRVKPSLCKALVRHPCIGQQMCRLRTSDVDHDCSSSSMLVDYECAPWSSGRQPARRDDICTTTSTNTTLSCPNPNTVIRSFNFAYYGLIDGSCRSGLMPGSCSRNVQLDASKLCIGKSRCDVSADQRSFGRPCSSSSAASASNATHEIAFRFAASFRCGSPTNDSTALGNSSSARYDQAASLQRHGSSSAATISLSGLVLALIISIA